MCGIAGIVGEHDLVVSERIIRAMMAAQSHRGPDNEGFTVAAGMSLGHRRLAIIDRSESANQPMWSPTRRYTLVFNVEIYNFRELRSRLCEYRYRTVSDAEVILAAYERYGPDCVQHLDGMFAFAIWDADEKTLFMARDRLGKKPLYYAQVGSALLFASEQRALLESNCLPRSLDRPALADYLRLQSLSAPRTLLEHIRLLQPASAGLFRNGRLDVTRYWTMHETARHKRAGSRVEATARVGDLLGEAVERRLVGDVPQAVFLSGGVDSTAIVALMSERSGQTINTFTISFDEPAYDESNFAQLVAKKFKTNHLQVTLSASELLNELPAALAAMDYPTADGLNTYVVAQAANQHGFRVAHSGLGGDELFAGYSVFRQYQRMMESRLLHRIPRSARANAARAIFHLSRSHTADKARLLASCDVRFRSIYPIFRQIFSEKEVAALTRGACDNRLMDPLFSESDFSAIEALSTTAQTSIGELSTYTVNVLLRDADQMGMAHPVEIRAPFLDYQLAEYVLGLSLELNDPRHPKQLLLDAMGDRIPKEVSNRSKMGFSFPWPQWIRGDLRGFCQSSLTLLADHPAFCGDAVINLWHSFLAGDRRINWVKVWQLVVLGDWLYRNGIDE